MAYRKNIALSLAILIGVYAVGAGLFFWWYQVERQSFAEALCENLDKPELQCHGACQVKKLLKADQAQPNTLREVRWDMERFFSLLAPDTRIQSHEFFAKIEPWLMFPPFLEPASALFRSRLLRPPGC